MEPLDSILRRLFESVQNYEDLSRDVDLLHNILINLRKGVRIQSLAFNDARIKFICDHIMYIVENGIKITVDTNKPTEK